MSEDYHPEQEVADDLWLRDRVIARLQRLIEPSAMGNAVLVADMARARRLLRKMGVNPITESTPFEEAVLRIRRAAPTSSFLRGVMVHKAEETERLE